MKFEKMIVTFKNISQKKEVEKILINDGLKFTGTRLNDCLATYVAHNGFTDSGIGLFGEPRHTYQQFMEKYGMTNLKSKVEEAKKTLGLNNHELSLKLGHQKRYITNALLDPSVKRQKNIILKIDALLLKESNDLTHDFEGKALHKHIDDGMMISKSEYESMKKEIDHKTQIAEKHADMRNKAELRVSELEDKLSLSDLYGGESWNKYLSEKKLNSILTQQKNAISIWLAVSILIIVVMLAFGVLHFNGVV